MCGGADKFPSYVNADISPDDRLASIVRNPVGVSCYCWSLPAGTPARNPFTGFCSISKHRRFVEAIDSLVRRSFVDSRPRNLANTYDEYEDDDDDRVLPRSRIEGRTGGGDPRSCREIANRRFLINGDRRVIN